MYTEVGTYDGQPVYGAHIQGPIVIGGWSLYFQGQPGYLCRAYYDYPGNPPHVPPRLGVLLAGPDVLIDGICPASTVGVRLSADVFKCRATCQDHEKWDTVGQRCMAYRDRYWDDPSSCSAGAGGSPGGNPSLGNPIFPLTGAKRQSLPLISGVGDEALTATYDTREYLPRTGSTEGWMEAPPPSFGALWHGSMHKRLVFQSLGALNGDVSNTIAAYRGAGVWQTFNRVTSTQYALVRDPSVKLTLASGEWLLLDPHKGTIDVFDTSGVLLRTASRSGALLTYQYSAGVIPGIAPQGGLLLEVADAFDRKINFTYVVSPVSGAPPVIATAKGPDGRITSFGYDASGNLQTVTWPDAKIRTHLYQRQDLPWAMTGVLDEEGVQTATYTYDSLGRAASTERGNGVERHAVAYGQPPMWSVTETPDYAAGVIWRDHRWQVPQGIAVTTPLGQSTTMSAMLQNGMSRLTSRSQPAGSGCAASVSAQTYDANGNVEAIDDFNGRRTCYAIDAGRTLETVRVEGLANGASCGVTAPQAGLPGGSRKITTDWHPSWALRTKVAEPGRITYNVYNGQQDPFDNNAVANCAPAAAPMPGGMAVPVLCRRVQRATLDTTGAQGFAAAPDTDVALRDERWSYNAKGRVTSYDGPLPGTGDTTQYTYYNSTNFAGTGPESPGYTTGDLQQLTLPGNLVTQFTAYNRAGQPKEVLDAGNNVLTTFVYDERGRRTSSTTAGQTTQSEYWGTGLLKRLTRPDGSWLDYEYDAAHRLFQVSDNTGVVTTYVLDNVGNRTQELVKDSNNTPRRQTSRGIDDIGRVQQVTGRE